MKNEMIKSSDIVHVASASDEDDDSIDLRGLLLTLWRGKWVIAVCILMALALSVLAVSQLEARYRATATVMFDPQRTNVIDDVVEAEEFAKDTLQNQIQILRSNNLIERVVDDLKLDRYAEFNPTLRVEEAGAFDRLRSIIGMPPEVRELLRNLGILSPPAPPVDAERTARNERLAVIQNVKNNLTMNPVAGSRVIEISFTSQKPERAARIANGVTEQYTTDQLQGKLEQARSATTWLSGRVQELEEVVNTSENRIEVLREKLSIEAGQSLEMTNQQLQALSGSLAVARTQLSQTESKGFRLAAALRANQDLGAVPEFRDSDLIANYRQQESALVSQELQLKTTVGEGHPRLVRLRAQIEEIRTNMQEEAKRVVTAVQIDVDSLKAQVNQLSQEVRALETKALGQSRDEIQLRQLEREAQANRSLYENLLGKLQETVAQESLQATDIRILSSAEPPTHAQSQRKKIIFAGSMILGSMLGVAIVFLLDRLNNTFRAPQQLSELTGHNVLATIPAAGKHMKRADIVQQLREKPNSSLAEAIRNLRTSILFSNVDNPPKVVMFTSSVPREGKSTTSMLMALTSRQMGKSAIIVDCDLRLPALAKLLDVDDKQPGLLSLMNGTATVNDVIHKDPTTGLHVLMTRNSERQAQINAADVLSSQKFKDLIKALSEHYELVILDTPPTLVVTDARIVSSLADAIVYAVRWDSTPRDAVAEGLKELSSIDANVTGVVLTLVNEQRASRYSYDGYSYHKGRYRDYYEVN